MNVEQAQKVNRLAKELLAHGIAASSSDAHSRAEQMVVGSQTVEQQRQSESVERQERFERDVSSISSQVRELTFVVKQLKAAYAKVVSELDELKSRKPVVPQPSLEPKERHVQPVKAEAPGGHPKTRGFSHDDISIEKVFYFGQK